MKKKRDPGVMAAVRHGLNGGYDEEKRLEAEIERARRRAEEARCALESRRRARRIEEAKKAMQRPEGLYFLRDKERGTITVGRYELDEMNFVGNAEWYVIGSEIGMTDNELDADYVVLDRIAALGV